MSYPVSITEEYVKSRINNWYINIWENKIYGDLKLFGVPGDYFRGGYIVSYVDNYVLAKIDCRLYALVLGNISEEKVAKYQLYKDYLNTKVSKPFIVL
ncbi:hypothetical protein QKU48_gp1193 [Fadolivirus algeromassiliense]|jgi:hypothetical protein|uniref:Uncharacterized protein n=1 Tax=Fadolivirus FV1/VV64 TaxID=3070911 RepID=A0A7D3UV76_9VIRU|nr:hypothetical protein QKU48_gp1193 [Fadolivirus algeromassiliense]QKF94651.1 hypothetical protein Fadolivirus_1_1193 [Fadolivirus FV1/VV64]